MKTQKEVDKMRDLLHCITSDDDTMLMLLTLEWVMD